MLGSLQPNVCYKRVRYIEGGLHCTEYLRNYSDIDISIHVWRVACDGWTVAPPAAS